MSRIRTEEFLERLATGDFGRVRLRAMHQGSFIMILESRDEASIHENADGSVKEYPKVDNALTWLSRMTKVTEIVVDIGLLRETE